MSRFRIAALLFALISLTSFLSAQSSTGTIQGTVVDPQGAVIPNASVTITNAGTNRAVQVNSNGEGLFSLPSLDPGPYSVQVKAPNFKTTTEQVVLQTAQVVNLDIALTTGATSETVEQRRLQLSTPQPPA